MASPLTIADLPKGLPKRQARFLLHLSLAPSLDRQDYQVVTGVSHTTARRDLAALIAAGHILRAGRGRGVRYSLTFVKTDA
jgi:DeoR/GlpR family transcriptional regulator of sugar metabolism